MADTRGPEISFNPSNHEKITLYWFARIEEDARKELEEELNGIIERLAIEDSSLLKKRVQSIAWIRNYEPTSADILSTMRRTGKSACPFLAVTSDYRETRSLHVVHSFSDDKNRSASASYEAAIRVYLRQRPYVAPASWEEIFEVDPYSSDDLELSFPTAKKGQNHEPKKDTLPPHIPSDIQLEDATVTLFSLVKLTHNEIKRLRERMDDTNDEVKIYNWPHDTPADHTDAYNIFQNVKPPLVSPCEETFVFFIDIEFIDGPKRDPVIIYIKEQTPTENQYDRKNIPYERHKLITGGSGSPQRLNELWKCVFHPPAKRGSVNGVCVNWAFDRFEPFERSQAESSYPHTVISPPSMPVFGGRGGYDFFVFVLCPITVFELRALKAMIKIEDGSGQYILLDLENDQMDTLLAYFDSPAFREYSQPPWHFCAIDRNALRSLMFWWPKERDITWDEFPPYLLDDNHPGDSVDNPPFLLFADSLISWHQNDTDDLIASESPGYQFARLDLSNRDSLRDVVANLGSNMFFEELTSNYLDGDEIAIVLWPEYKGLSREFLR